MNLGSANEGTATKPSNCFKDTLELLIPDIKASVINSDAFLPLKIN